MKALSVCQPWAWAIIHSTKRIENRTWPTVYRGTIAIHAGKTRSRVKSEDPEAWPGRYGVEFPADNELAFGAVIGVVDIIDCVRLEHIGGEHSQQWAEGPWCWILDNPRAIKPFDCKGQLMLFDVPEERLRLGVDHTRSPRFVKQSRAAMMKPRR